MCVFSAVVIPLPARFFLHHSTNKSLVKVAVVCMLLNRMAACFFRFVLLDLPAAVTWLIVLSFLKRICAWPSELSPRPTFLSIRAHALGMASTQKLMTLSVRVQPGTPSERHVQVSSSVPGISMGRVYQASFFSSS